MTALNAALDIKIDEVSASRVYLGATEVWSGTSDVWTPADLFAQGQQGVWYEPKPEYLFQDEGGTVPVTADGDPVGSMLDLSRGLELGPNMTEAFDLTTFDLPFRVQDFTADSFTVEDGSTDAGVIGRQGEFGKRYTATIHYTRLSPGGDITLVVGSAAPADGVRVPMEETGTLTLTRNCTAADNTTLIIALFGEGASVRIDSIELREVAGNHATQSTSAARPTYRTDGTLHWLAFDGTDDLLEFDATFLRGRSHMLSAIAHGGYSGSATGYSVSSRQTGDTILFGYRFAGSSREIRARRIRADSQTNLTLPSGLDRYSNVAFSDYQAGKLRAWQDGDYVGEANYGSTGLSSDQHSAGQIGALNSNFNFNGKVWAVLYTVDAPEHEGEVDDISAYFTELAGAGV